MDIFCLWMMRHESIRHIELRQHKIAVDLTELITYRKIVKPSGWPERRVAEGRRKEKDEGNRKAWSIGADPHRESKLGVRSPNIQTDGGTRPMSNYTRGGSLAATVLVGVLLASGCAHTDVRVVLGLGGRS